MTFACRVWLRECPRTFTKVKYKEKLSDGEHTKLIQLTEYIYSAEDIILQKLRWYRMGMGISDKQWRDLLGVLKVQALRLDFEYLQQWGRNLELDDLLERALLQAGLEFRTLMMCQTQ